MDVRVEPPDVPQTVVMKTFRSLFSATNCSPPSLQVPVDARTEGEVGLMVFTALGRDQRSMYFGVAFLRHVSRIASQRGNDFSHRAQVTSAVLHSALEGGIRRCFGSQRNFRQFCLFWTEAYSVTPSVPSFTVSKDARPQVWQYVLKERGTPS